MTLRNIISFTLDMTESGMAVFDTVCNPGSTSLIALVTCLNSLSHSRAITPIYQSRCLVVVEIKGWSDSGLQSPVLSEFDCSMKRTRDALFICISHGGDERCTWGARE